MRFLVIRSGSGWGGIVSRYIIDTEERVKIDLDKHFIITGEDIFDLKGVLDRIKKEISHLPEGVVDGLISPVSYEDILKRPTTSFDKNSRTNLDLSMFDLDWFENNIKICQIDIGGMPVFDMQCDDVFVLMEDKAIQVLRSTYPQIWIKDEQIREVFNKITGIDPAYETLIT